MSELKLDASTVSRIVRAATSGSVCRTQKDGSVEVTQKYAVHGAFAPYDSRVRRELRAYAAAEALRKVGYAVELNGDRLTVTLPK